MQHQAYSAWGLSGLSFIGPLAQLSGMGLSLQLAAVLWHLCEMLATALA